MIRTLVAMSPAIAVLLLTGTLTILLAWWLSVVGEGRDEWLTGDDAQTDPNHVIWPRYCLGKIPCDHTETHGSHFWKHYSGYPAVCEGR